MAIAFDIVVILLVCYFVFKGVKKGFVSSIISFFGFIIATIISSYLARMLSDYIYKTFVFSQVKQGIIKSFPTGIDSLGTDLAVTNFMNNQPSFIKEMILQKYNSNQGISEVLAQKGAKLSDSIAETLARDVLGPVIIQVIQFILFFVLLFVCLFLVKFVARAFNNINRIPIIGQLNSVLGGVCGLAQAVLVILILSVAINFYISLNPNDKAINKNTIEKTMIFNKIYTNNPFLVFKNNL